MQYNPGKIVTAQQSSSTTTKLHPPEIVDKLFWQAKYGNNKKMLVKFSLFSPSKCFKNTLKANKINRESREVNERNAITCARLRTANVNGDAAIWRRNDTSTMNVAVEYGCVCFQVKKRWIRLLYKMISQTWCLVFLMNNYLLCEDRGISGIDEWSLIILGPAK